MDRRRFLTGVAASLTAAAGCTGAEEEPAPGASPTPTPGPPRITDRSLEKRERCEQQGAASISIDGSAVVAEGCIVGKNGCQEAVLESASYDAEGDELRVRVTTEAPSDSGACTQQLVDRPYTVTVTFENGRPGTTTVVHDGAGGEQQAGQADTA